MNFFLQEKDYISILEMCGVCVCVNKCVCVCVYVCGTQEHTPQTCHRRKVEGILAQDQPEQFAQTLDGCMIYFREQEYG